VKEEISNLISEIREQILYLQELGVDDFSADLPEIDGSKFKVQGSKSAPNAKTEDRRPNLEKFVPPQAPVAAPQQKNENQAAKTEPNSGAPPPSSRLSLLEKTKLSRLPELPRQSPAPPSGFDAQNQEQNKGETTMPKQKTTATENLTESLFADMAQTLPESGETLEDIHRDIGNCTRCPLWEGRTKIVHSEGNRQADLMFVGEAPGANEDAEGRPFVGKAGLLLNKIIEAIGMRREDVFIGNINRCRPPGNRTPTLAEAHTCRPFLTREISVVRPKIIVVLGNTATQNLLDTKVGITKLRGEFQDYYGVKVMPTFHPAYLLRDPSKKRETWEDMKKVRDELNKLK
jgi:DNA polymerase